MLGLSQTVIGQALGLSFQQVQKYETGMNRISASRLYEFSQILEVPVEFFFEGAPAERPNRRKAPRRQPVDEERLLIKRETLELVRAFYRIDSKRKREVISDLVKSLGRD